MLARRLCLAFATVGLFIAVSSSHAQAGNTHFIVYDNVFYQNTPDLTVFGMQTINLIYEKSFWSDRAHETVLPPRAVFDAVAKQATKAGPLVLDIEYLGLNSAENEKELETLVEWAHQDLPGRTVGFYGTNTLTKVKPENLVYAKQLAAKVDAMFPPMYTYNADQAAWAARAQMEIEEAHTLAPGKPVYFYLQPQYHHTTPLAYQYVDEAYWAFQLDTCRRLSDGVVIWTGTRWPWDSKAGWWVATQAFLRIVSHSSLQAFDQRLERP